MKTTTKNQSVLLFASIAIITILISSGCRKDSIDKFACDDEKAVTSEETNTDMARYSQPQSVGQFVANEVLVKFKEGVSDENKGRAFRALAAEVKEHIVTRAMERAGNKDGIYLLHVPASVEQAMTALRRLGEVEYAEPNYIYTYGATSNDPYYTNGSLWGMYGASSTPGNQYGSHAESAWSNGNTGSSSVIVGIIDEGIFNGHVDLQANCWVNPYETVNGIDDDGNGYKDDIYGWNFVGNNNVTYASRSDEHGTHVAGTIGGVGGNDIGVAGVCWTVKMISCKFLGKTGGTTANAIKAVDYITDLKSRHGLPIVATNNSWSGGGYSQALKDAIDRADNASILFVAAAGNNGSNNDAFASYPSNYASSNVIAVAAITSAGNLSSFSNYGATQVDLAAPGSNIVSTVPVVQGKNTVSGYASFNGTSMAAPHVTGAAALYAASHSGVNAAGIKAAILGNVSSTPSLAGKCLTGGRLNVTGF